MSLKKQYRDLEMQVLHGLRNKIENSTYISKHTNTKAIEVKIDDYEELSIIDDNLVFLNNDGNYFSYFLVGLEELIDILN